MCGHFNEADTAMFIDIHTVRRHRRQLYTAMYQCQGELYHICTVNIIGNLHVMIYNVEEDIFFLSLHVTMNCRHDINYLYFQ